MQSNKVIYIRRQQSVAAVRLESILYMEKRCRKIILHASEGETICFYGKFDSLIPMLDERFVHPHQSYIINMQQIHHLGRQEAVLFNGDRIAMGSRCFGRLKKAYDQYIMENIRLRTPT